MSALHSRRMSAASYDAMRGVHNRCAWMINEPMGTRNRRTMSSHLESIWTSVIRSGSIGPSPLSGWDMAGQAGDSPSEAKASRSWPEAAGGCDAMIGSGERR